jgi:hypothetical protein
MTTMIISLAVAAAAITASGFLAARRRRGGAGSRPATFPGVHDYKENRG